MTERFPLTDCHHTDIWVEESPGCADPAALYQFPSGEWRDGVRPEFVVETPLDIELLTRRKARPYLICRWCGKSARPTSTVAALCWFATHPCAQGLAA